MKVVLTGGTGFLGRRMIEQLRKEGHGVHVLGRRVPESDVEFTPWPSAEAPLSATLFEGADAVIHLAGEPVSQRWTQATKQAIRTSRVEGTRQIAAALRNVKQPPAVLVSASATGIYGDRADEVLAEGAAPGQGFLAEVCREWEAAADVPGMRVVHLRTGIVLGPEGGALAKILPPFRFGAGGVLGSGQQWMPWIHVADWIRLIRFTLSSPSMAGPVNAVAPHPVRNLEFTRILAEVLHRPTLLPIPAWSLRLIFGEMASVVLGSQRVEPRAIQQTGFCYQYGELEPALAQLVAR